MSRKLFKGVRPECLYASVTDPSQRALVRRFKARAAEMGVSAQKLLLRAVQAFLEGPEG